MSEYQWYEFVALDRMLTPKEMAALRAISTRAEISPTRFWNEYNWGDLKADPAELLARYFDAHLYFSNWGTHRFMLRLPASRIDLQQWKPYFPGGPATLTEMEDHVVIELWWDAEEPDDEFEAGLLGVLTPLRAQLLQGDMSAAYLAWLLAVQAEEVTASTREPPVPAGLREPSAPLAVMIEFLGIDPDLVAAAAEGGDEAGLDPAAVRAWVTSLPPREKDRWLSKAIDEPNRPIGTDLLATFRRQRAPRRTSGRTVAELLARAEELRVAREELEAKQAAAARSKAEAARREHLAALARQGEQAWERLDKLIEGRKYDQAVRLTIDLRDVALTAGRVAEFEGHLAVLRKRYSRRRGYLLPGMRKRGKTVKSATGQPGLRGMRRHRSLRHEAWPVARRGGDEMEPG